MKIAEINKKTGEVVHIFESNRLPKFHPEFILYCEDITGEINLTQGDLKTSSGFVKQEALPKVESVPTVDKIMNKLLEIETKLEGLGVVK